MTNKECIDILKEMESKTSCTDVQHRLALIHAIRICQMMECKDLLDICRDCGACFIDWDWRNT